MEESSPSAGRFYPFAPCEFGRSESGPEQKTMENKMFKPETEYQISTNEKERGFRLTSHLSSEAPWNTAVIISPCVQRTLTFDPILGAPVFQS